ncbi:hypothetical protein [Actinophytocola sediminis]
MFLVDGGGGSVPTGPTYSGTQSLRIEPAAIPGALEAFREAYDRVTRKVSELGGLPITQWAGDPVSGETAKLFGERTNGGGSDSAYECLLGYQRQLANAIESLELTEQAYIQTEGTNSERWGTYA